MPAVCTSGGPGDVETALRTLRQGRTTDPQTMARWRAADHADKEGLQRLRAICAPDNASRDTDVAIAEALLRDRGLFVRTLESVQLAAQAR